MKTQCNSMVIHHQIVNGLLPVGHVSTLFEHSKALFTKRIIHPITHTCSFKHFFQTLATCLIFVLHSHLGSTQGLVTCPRIFWHADWNSQGSNGSLYYLNHSCPSKVKYSQRTVQLLSSLLRYSSVLSKSWTPTSTLPSLELLPRLPLAFVLCSCPTQLALPNLLFIIEISFSWG